MRSARAYLIPLTVPRCAAGMSAKRSTRSSSASRVISKPWMPPSEGSPASAWIAAARLRIVPPIPTIRRPQRGSQAASSSSVVAHVRAQRLARLLRRRIVVGEEVLGHPHGAQRPRAEPAGMAAEDLDELQRAAAEIEHGAVRERRRVDGREVAEVRLLIAAENANAQAGLVAHAVEEDLLVRRVADRARRDGLDALLADRGGSAEMREHLGHLERALHRLDAELAAGVEPLADADRLVDLVGAFPPAVSGREDDEPKRVRAHVDDRGPLLGHGRRAQLEAGRGHECWSLEAGRRHRFPARRRSRSRYFEENL